MPDNPETVSEERWFIFLCDENPMQVGFERDEYDECPECDASLRSVEVVPLATLTQVQERAERRIAARMDNLAIGAEDRTWESLYKQVRRELGDLEREDDFNPRARVEELERERCTRHAAYNPEGDCVFCDVEEAEARAERAEEALLTENQIGHLYSIAEAALGRAQKAARDHRNSGGRHPPEFIVKALYDDVHLLQQVAEKQEHVRALQTKDEPGG